MVYSARAKTLAAVWLTLSLLVCGSSGCIRAPYPGLPGCGVCSLLPFCGCAPQQGPVCAVDPVCYGYQATCWYPWPDQCGGCPTVPLPPSAAETDITGEDEINAAESPHPAGLPIEPTTDGPKAADWEPLPPPDSGKDGGKKPAAPPAEDKGKSVGSSPPGGGESRSGEEGIVLPPEPKGAKTPKSEGPSPEPPVPDSSNTKASQSTLKFVSFNEPKAPPAGRLGEASSMAKEQSGGPTPSAKLHRLPPPPRASGSSPRNEQGQLVVLQALRTSFSPPAPHRPPEKAQSTGTPGS
jgi:hypothetical protein